MQSELQNQPFTFNIKGQIIELTRPWVMGILNLTPDSFYGPSRTMTPEEAVERVRHMIREGIDIIDIGACSTRPGSLSPSADEELARLTAPLEAIRKEFPNAIISVDTFRASVAEECLSRWKVDIINDISGGSDADMLSIVARYKAIYILMHMRGNPSDMDSFCRYDGDVITDVIKELAFKLNEARKKGICDVIIDPGFGFAKTTDQNLEILSNLNRLGVLGCPVLVGISRKRMAREACACNLSESLTATVALNSVALLKGASIIRVHDIREGIFTAKTLSSLWKVSG